MNLQVIQDKIFNIRDQKVMLDFDLAELYQVETRVLKQAVRRNLKRFPTDFMFELSKEEYSSLRSQIVTLAEKGRGKHSKYMPFAFTEQGVAMLSSVLKSNTAIEINIYIIRVFVQIRQLALSHTELSEKLSELENKYNKQFKDVYEALNYLVQKDKQKIEQGQRKQIRIQIKK
ncbi:MAG: ORF6N domain-containing protein [Flavobacteriaceae bacterium]|nr:ORF6N domain-containing protein [Flavobacteriaceae bacterium]